MLKKILRYEQAALDIIQGRKIDLLPDNQSLCDRYTLLLGRMHAAHFISAEPASYIVQPQYQHLDRKYMGKTHLHALSVALYNQAEDLRNFAIQKGQMISPFEVLGLNYNKRRTSMKGEDFEVDTGKIGVLTCGDNVSLQQALNVIRRRISSPDVHYTTPLIIQNTDHFWEGVFNTGSPDWPDQKAEMKRCNIHYSSGVSETATLLAELPYGQKTEPSKVQFELGGYIGHPDPDQAFATTDQIKMGQTMEGHVAIGATGLLHRLIDVVGRFPSPPEESYSYEGNLEDEKMRTVYNLFKSMGRARTEQFFFDAGYTDINKINIMTHDGGLGFCLENAQGKRRIDLFTPEHFPNSVHKLNPQQMAPSVELAYMKRTDGLKITMERMFTRAREIIAEDPSFALKDLKSYDVSMFASARLSDMLDAADRGEDYEAFRDNVVSVFSTHTLHVSEQPKFMPHENQETPETVNYLIPWRQDTTRSEEPDWALRGPNVESYRLLRKYIGAIDPELAPAAELEEKTKLSRVRMGLLGVPSMIMGKPGDDDLASVRSKLSRQFLVSASKGEELWRRFRDDPQAVLSLSDAPTNPHFMEYMREFLDHSRVLYYGQRKHPLSLDEKAESYLLLIKAMIRNQFFNHTDIVADRQAAAEVLKILQHKQMLGQVLQQTDHLLTLVDGANEAAEKISSIVRGNALPKPPVERHYYADDQIENNECIAISGYFSATNCNQELMELVYRTGYLLAVNGFTFQTGGGRNGLMGAANDGFQAGIHELKDKGYNFPNQLINIQCVDTEAIELPYDRGGLMRSHPDIEAREGHLQRCDMSFAGPGGIGSVEEILTRVVSINHGLLKAEDQPFCFLNPLIDSPIGKVGVYDPLMDIFPESYLREKNMDMTVSPEGILDRACAVRQAKQRNQYTIPLTSLRETLQDAQRRKEGALNSKSFRPPFGIYTGPVGGLPPASQFTPDIRQAAIF